MGTPRAQSTLSEPQLLGRVMSAAVMQPGPELKVAKKAPRSVGLRAFNPAAPQTKKRQKGLQRPSQEKLLEVLIRAPPQAEQKLLPAISCLSPETPDME
mmetsp:Transcript_34227/g.62042  ORF Transcript_34227/g.62042 Transcript_34227/m.62042 type:complete len:99 (-) Transcript_34227:672-968(-)